MTGPAFSWTIEALEDTPSTQDYARQQASLGVAEGFCVRALRQSQGRGRHGRIWESGAENLTFSLVLRPACTVDRVGELAFVLALALANAVLQYVERADTVMLKWPNDLLLDGRKCAGILIESDCRSDGGVNFIVAGMGVNIINAPEGAASLSDYCGVTPQPEELMGCILREVGYLYAHWQEEGFEAVRRQWLACAHPPGTAMKVRHGAEVLTGFFHNIDEKGNLLLQADDLSLKTITAGEIIMTARNESAE